MLWVLQGETLWAEKRVPPLVRIVMAMPWPA